MKYTYETLPGQTIIRTAKYGYTKKQLIEELRQNGMGTIVTTDEGRTDSFCEKLAGKAIKSLKGAR